MDPTRQQPARRGSRAAELPENPVRVHLASSGASPSAPRSGSRSSAVMVEGLGNAPALALATRHAESAGPATGAQAAAATIRQAIDGADPVQGRCTRSDCALGTWIGLGAGTVSSFLICLAGDPPGPDGLNLPEGVVIDLAIASVASGVASEVGVGIACWLSQHRRQA